MSYIPQGGGQHPSARHGYANGNGNSYSGGGGYGYGGDSGPYGGYSGGGGSEGPTSLKNRIGSYFDNNDLPMYKDKPFSSSSRRAQPFWKKNKPLAGLGVFFLVVIAYYGLFSGGSGSKSYPHKTHTVTGDHASILTQKADWDLRRESVREAFKISWDGYEKYAWGKDEYYPISKNGRFMTPTGMGWIIVDALDSLILMNLTSRLVHAREWITTSLNYGQDHDVNTFETTIRMLGGFLSAHYLSTEYPDLATIPQGHEGKHGEDLYIEKATDLADRLLAAFESSSGIPYASVNLGKKQGLPSHADGGASSTAEATTIQLEFKYIALLLGEKLYWDPVEKVMKLVDDQMMEGGLLPIYIHPDSGTFRGTNIRLGSRGDSYYEYLIKQYLQTSGEEPIYLDMWEDALAGIRKYLITYSKDYHLSIVAERPSGLKSAISPKMDHLVCFLPGTVALGATMGKTVGEARLMGRWTAKQESEITLAKELMKTCWGMYKATETGLAAEITYFNVHDPPLMEDDAIYESKPIDWHDASERGQRWKKDYSIKPMDAHNLQRPETAESLFYLWRITGDPLYREWGWEMFCSFVNHTAIEGGGGFTSLNNANRLPPETRDNMESFWLAETLKYFYLLFSPEDFIPLDKVVINTEGHIFPRMKLQRGLKTNWVRKPRKHGTDEMRWT